MVAVRKIETHAVVGRIILALCKMPERAVHAEMHGQPAWRIESYQKVLTMTPRFGQLDPVEPAAKLVGRDAGQYAGIIDSDLAYGPA